MMTTATKKTESIDLIGTADAILTISSELPELVSWLRAAHAGNFALPPAVVDLAEQALSLAQQRETLGRRPLADPMSASVLLTGIPAADAAKINARTLAAAEEWDRQAKLLTDAITYLPFHSDDVFKVERDRLIAQELRRAVAAALGEARPITEKLSKYGPGFKDGLLGQGTAAELGLWRESRVLHGRLDTLSAAWQQSMWRALTRDLAQLRPLRPGGWYCWSNPDAITDESLRLGHDREVLSIVAQPSEYKLIAPGEIQPLIERLDSLVERDAKGQPLPGSPGGFARLRAGVCS